MCPCLLSDRICLASAWCPRPHPQTAPYSKGASFPLSDYSSPREPALGNLLGSRWSSFAKPNRQIGAPKMKISSLSSVLHQNLRTLWAFISTFVMMKHLALFLQALSRCRCGKYYQAHSRYYLEKCRLLPILTSLPGRLELLINTSYRPWVSQKSSLSQESLRQRDEHEPLLRALFQRLALV